MTKEHRRGSAGAIAPVLALALIAALAVVLLTRGEDEDRLTVRAVFADASPLLPGNDVRMSGVRVGTISKITQVDEGAELTMELDPEALPVYQDATATIRPVSLLGERFVELSPGTEAAGPMPEGGAIAIASTHATTDLDQVLNSLDDPTSAALAALVGTLGEGLDGNGTKVKDAIAALAPALSNTTALSQVLKEHNTTLDHLVVTMEQVAAGLATGEGAALDRLVASTDRALSVTAENEAALRLVIQELPETIATAQRTLGELQTAALSATPTLEKLRPTTSKLPQISKELLRFADSAEPALSAANPVLKEASKLLDEARPVAEALRQAGPALQADAANLKPISKELTANLTPVFEFIRGWALTTNGKDGLSHYFRANLVVTTGMVTGLLGDIADGPKIDLPGGKDGVPDLDLGALLPDLGLSPLLESLGLQSLLPQSGSNGSSSGGLLGGLLKPRKTADGGVTGLRREQETGALGFLLGGGN